jgi:hypothetical protein
MSGIGMTALPSKYFAIGPYRAESLGGSHGWWGVMNKNGFNCLSFAEKRGAVVTDEAHAHRIADEWNKRIEPFVYPPDPYVPPVTTRWTDEQMAAHIHSRRYNFELRRWE